MTEAYITLATNDQYAIGAMVLACSLKDAGTTKLISIMVTEGISESVRHQLSLVFDYIHEVNVLDSTDSRNLQLLSRPDLGITFTKLHCWNLTCYKKAVFLDADTLVLKNVDELFEREELSAAPDVGWPDCFNSGVFVFTPNSNTYQSLLRFALERGSFDGGDQGLLNDYFGDWATKDITKHLPFVYNTVSTSFYSYPPALKRFGDKIKIVHFIGAQKPWHQTTTSDLSNECSFLNSWNKVFINSLMPKFPDNLASISSTFGNLTILNQNIEKSRKIGWESGKIDYMGVDAFENIKKKLNKAIETKHVDPKSKQPKVKISSEGKKNIKK